MTKYSELFVRGKIGLVVNSPDLEPWAEGALLYRYGAEKIYSMLEWGHHPFPPKRILVDEELASNLSLTSPRQLALEYLRRREDGERNSSHPLEHGLLDFVFAYSVIEHSGLGRYGDNVDPFADLDALARIHCLLKPGGVLFLGVPTGPDSINSYWHRIYGTLRLALAIQPQAIENSYEGQEKEVENDGGLWQVLDVIGSYEPLNDPSRIGHDLAQPVWVLRKPSSR